MKRSYGLLLAIILGVLLFPLQWVSLSAPTPPAGLPLAGGQRLQWFPLSAPSNSGSWFRHALAQQPQDAPERLIPLEELDTLPLAEADNDSLHRDPRRWRARLRENNLRQQEIFPGVDLVFAGNKQKLEAVLIVKAGAGLSTIHFDFPQAVAVAADAQGTIWVASSDGDLGLLRQNQTVLRDNQKLIGEAVAFNTVFTASTNSSAAYTTFAGRAAGVSLLRLGRSDCDSAAGDGQPAESVYSVDPLRADESGATGCRNN